MQVILLERIAGVGQMGDEVRVRDGYARNYLLPQGKALRANEGNRKRFEEQRVQLEARNLERRTEAEGLAGRLDGQSFVVVRQAAETGQLYGSVTTRDLAETITAAGVSISRNQIELNQPIKTIGLHPVAIALHPEVSVTITVNVARSTDEAERQARGEDLTVFGGDEDEDTGASAEAAVEAEPAKIEADAGDTAEGDAAGGDDAPRTEPA